MSVLPPHDVGAEEDLLGALLERPQAIAMVRGRLDPEHFWNPDNAKVYEAILACELKNLVPLTPDEEAAERSFEQRYGLRLIRVLPVESWLVDHGGLQTAPTQRQVRQRLQMLILERPGIMVRLGEVVQRIRDKARLRQCLALVRVVEAKLLTDNGPHDAQAFLEDLAVKVTGLRFAGAESVVEDLAAVRAPLVVDGIAELRSGVDELDQLLGGWRPRETTIVSGPPGGGKTAFMLEQCSRAIEDGDGALLFSMEMPADIVRDRVLCRRARVDLGDYLKRRHELTADELHRLDEAASWLGSSAFKVDARKGLNVEQIRSAAFQVQLELEKKGKRLGLIAVDYFQLMGLHPNVGAREYEEKHLNQNGLGLVELSEELRIPILLAAQTTGDGAEIRQCKAMRQHAQNWVHIKRGQQNGEVRTITFDVRKGRNAGDGEALASFVGKYQRFGNSI